MHHSLKMMFIRIKPCEPINFRIKFLLSCSGNRDYYYYTQLRHISFSVYHHHGVLFSHLTNLVNLCSYISVHLSPWISYHSYYCKQSHKYFYRLMVYGFEIWIMLFFSVSVPALSLSFWNRSWFTENKLLSLFQFFMLLDWKGFNWKNNEKKGWVLVGKMKTKEKRKA